MHSIAMVLALLLISALMIPGQVTIVPLFILVRQMGLYNTHTALILPALINPFGVFLLRQYFITLPKELEDAARVDGANVFTIYWRIVMPLSIPSFIIVFLFEFQASWNNLQAALIYLNGILSHTVEKQAMLLGPLAAPSAVADEVAISRYATEAELQLGEQARRAIHGYIKDRMGRDSQLLFCRIDVVEGETEPKVIEVSLTDASLYLESVDGALDNFADAIASRAFW